MPKALNVNHNSFQRITIPTFYWLGIMASDGCIVKNRIGLTSKDKELIIRFKDFLKSDHKVCKKKDGCFYITVSSKQIIERLNYFGITKRKSLTLNIKNIPDNMINHFLRGILDGDGCIMFKKRNNYKDCSRICVTITSASDTFLNWINNNTPVNGYINTHSISINWYNKKDVIILGKWLYSGSDETTRLKRKYLKFKDILNHRSQAEIQRKLTEIDIIKINKEYKEGNTSQRILAEKYNVSQQTIYSTIKEIING